MANDDDMAYLREIVADAKQYPSFTHSAFELVMSTLDCNGEATEFTGDATEWIWYASVIDLSVDEATFLSQELGEEIEPGPYTYSCDDQGFKTVMHGRSWFENIDLRYTEFLNVCEVCGEEPKLEGIDRCDDCLHETRGTGPDDICECSYCKGRTRAEMTQIEMMANGVCDHKNNANEEPCGRPIVAVVSHAGWSDTYGACGLHDSPEDWEDHIVPANLIRIRHIAQIGGAN